MFFTAWKFCWNVKQRCDFIFFCLRNNPHLD
jgi:hypothetical protein